jgi:hypothetical protein
VNRRVFSQLLAFGVGCFSAPARETTAQDTAKSDAGETGVKRVLDKLRDELTNAMIASGCRAVADLNEGLLL